MFTGNAWFTGEDVATAAFNRRVEVKEAIKVASQSMGSDDENLWEAMLDAHLDGLDA